jgi:dihydrodipicolinate synthase/N-acetylneuraminate lyase
VLVLTPYYYKPQMTAEALRRHFLAVAEASPVPVYLYSMTLFTGVPWPPGLAADLASHPRIAGIKESSSDLGLLGRIITSVPARFEVACGSAPVLYPALCLGACAGVLAVANCAPALAVAIYRAVEAGDHARARKLQAALTPLASPSPRRTGLRVEGGRGRGRLEGRPRARAAAAAGGRRRGRRFARSSAAPTSPGD